MTVLCYHTVDADWSDPLAIHPAAFERQCRWLARHRRVLDLDRAVALSGCDGRLPRAAAAVTFDDGLAGVHDVAWPILRRTGIPFAVFVVTRTLTDERSAVDWIDDPPPVPPSTLTVEQVLELADAGVTIGSHSHTHRILPTLGDDECIQDLRRSREVLEDLLRRPVRHLAYPRGIHDERVRRCAARAGFATAFTLPAGPEPVGPLAIPRVGIYRGNSLAAVRIKASSGYGRLLRAGLAGAFRRTPVPA